MTKILIKSGWLGRNRAEWFEHPDDLGEHILAMYRHLQARGHNVAFAGEKREDFAPDLEIHIERQWPASRTSKKLLVYSEPAFVQPQNILFSERPYEIVFGWRTDRKTDSRYRRYVFPRRLTPDPNPGFAHRDILISCIAGNKNAVVRSRYNLYRVRQWWIDALSARIGKEFHLFGGGWNLKNHPVGFLAKTLFRVGSFRPFLARATPLESYRGRCESKREIMQRSLFTLCIENSSEPGSISEKIFDCFQYGSIPIYQGAPDIEELLPSSLYVRLEKYKSAASLVDFMKGFSELDYAKWCSERDAHYAQIARERSVDVFVNSVSRGVDELIGAL